MVTGLSVGRSAFGQQTDPAWANGRVVLSQRLSVPLALQGTTLGVCGNTGSGKSSLVSAILGEVSDL